MFTDTELKGFRAWMSKCPFDRSVQGAFDAAPKRRARDQEGEEPEEEPARRGNFMRLLKICARGMTPASWAQFQRDLLDGDGDDDDEGAEDEPPDFEAKPETGEKNEPAMDSRLAADYSARFPNAPKRTARYEPEAPKRASRSAGAALAYDKRFPDASRIGQG